MDRTASVMSNIHKIITSDPTRRVTIVIALIVFLLFCFMVLRLGANLLNELMKQEDLMKDILNVYKDTVMNNKQI